LYTKKKKKKKKTSKPVSILMRGISFKTKGHLPQTSTGWEVCKKDYINLGIVDSMFRKL